MFSVKDNLIEEVVQILSFVNQNKAKCGVESTEFVNDIHFKLCNLLSAMLSGPLSGRVYLATPESYISEAQKSDSIQKNFLITTTNSLSQSDMS